jgi:hypothetical protein
MFKNHAKLAISENFFLFFSPLSRLNTTIMLKNHAKAIKKA